MDYIFEQYRLEGFQLDDVLAVISTVLINDYNLYFYRLSFLPKKVAREVDSL